jgi:LmbE family N-acetylglucosaminyl deacetylase
MRQRLRRFLRMGRLAGDALSDFLRLPLVGPDTLFAPGAVLVLAPHPDDESLGCGGAIAAACETGRAVHVLILTDGAGSHPHSRAFPPDRLRALRQREARSALLELGLPATRVAFLNAKDGALPRYGRAQRALARRVAAHATALGAGTILTTWKHDPHGDHVAAARIGRDSARECGARLLYYPVWGWNLPEKHRLPMERPNGWRLDIAAQLAAKRRAIACHQSQLTPLIDDDPTGFRLAPGFLSLFDRPFEIFLLG